MDTYIGWGKASKPREAFIPNPKLKLLDQVSEVMRFKHYSLRTELTYREWIKHYISFHGKRHPRGMGRAEVERFLSDLAVRRKVAASTQNQAFNALLFLYRDVLHQELGQRCRAVGQDCETGLVPQSAPQLRHPLARSRI